MVDLSMAWIKGMKVNIHGRQNELAAKSPIDCSDPGDVEAVRKHILGSWEGSDSFGGTIRCTFGENGTITGGRNDRSGSATYTICNETIFWRPPGTLLVVKLENGQLKGHWEYAGYKGHFTLQRVPAESAQEGTVD
jgi:hypothetical protein